MSKKTYRYSDCFKLSVVTEIEKNGLTIQEARLKYGIKGGATIQKWLVKFGKNHLLNKVVRVETYNELRPHWSLNLKTPNEVHLKRAA